MFGHESAPSRIYRYGALTPTGNLELVCEQMRLAHRYRNALVAREIERRNQVAAAVARACPELAAVEAEVARLDSEIDQRKTAIAKRSAEARKRSGTVEERAALTAIRTRRRELYARARELKRTTYQHPDFVVEQEQIEAGNVADGKRLRAESGLFWGSYLAVEQAMQGCRTGAPPRFHRWTGEGRLAVQCQGGLDWTDARLGGDSRIRITGTDRRATLQFRIGSDGRKPIFAVVPVTIHRHPPAGCKIKWVYLHCRRIGTHEEWSVSVVLSRADGWPIEDAADGGSVGVEVGWRRVGSGLRVAVWKGSDGRSGELVIPERDMARWTRCETLQSTRDGNFNGIRDWLVKWLRSRDAPDWLRERLTHLGQWRSQARLAAVVIAWRTNRFAGDAEAFSVVENWRRQDKHLFDWESANRTKAIRWRDDRYRNFAAMLRRSYRAIAVERIDWTVEKPGPEVSTEESQAYAAMAEWRRVASVGRLAQLVRETAPLLVDADAAGTTTDCARCGEVNRRMDRAQQYHRCTGCGEMWDVDENAADWLLRAASGEAANAASEPAITDLLAGE